MAIAKGEQFLSYYYCNRLNYTTGVIIICKK